MPLFPVLTFAAASIAHGKKRSKRARRAHEEHLRREREAAEQRQREVEERMRCEREEAERRQREMEERLRYEREEAERRQREMEERLRREQEEAERRRRETEEQLRRQREEEERRQREIQEQLRREAEKTRAAEVAKELIEANWRAGVHPGITSLTQDQITQARSSYLDGKGHIAFVGRSGAGKSTLTNSIRGLKANETGAAAVNQNEGTRKIDRYADPKHAHQVWYDVPGAGTLDCPDWQYFMDKQLYVYDALVVVFSDRIMQNDLRVLSNAKELGIATFLVRSKSDQIMRNMQDDYEEDERASRERYIRSTREYVHGVLDQAEGVDANEQVYLVSREELLREVKGLGMSNAALDEQQLVAGLLSVRERK